MFLVLSLPHSPEIGSMLILFNDVIFRKNPTKLEALNSIQFPPIPSCPRTSPKGFAVKRVFGNFFITTTSPHLPRKPIIRNILPPPLCKHRREVLRAFACHNMGACPRGGGVITPSWRNHQTGPRQFLRKRPMADNPGRRGGNSSEDLNIPQKYLPDTIIPSATITLIGVRTPLGGFRLLD